MQKNKNLFRWSIILISFIVISLILWNTYQFFQNFKEEERSKMEIWTNAFNDAYNNPDINANISELSLTILQSNTTTPMIVANNKGVFEISNIKHVKNTDTLKIKQLITQFKNENKPIEVAYNNKTIITVYYGNSPLLNKLKYYPLALLLILLLFSMGVYFYYKSIKNAQQNKLWAGMAKETAHQIGTPLSSLIGWLEILKMENVSEDTITEMTKDIDRLQTITERFSKIGSIPKLERVNIVSETEKTYRYLKTRTSRLINFTFEAVDTEIYSQLNVQLYSWTIENLVKNAIDAMKGKGDLYIHISQLEDLVFIRITDNGKGILKSEFKKIFEPGFTTKKRGWGLGLSLSKRIIEDYHNGKIHILKSEINTGTTFEIKLKTVV